MIAFIGDVHDLLDPLRSLLHRLPHGIRAVVQVGDLWVWPDEASVPPLPDGGVRDVPRRPWTEAYIGGLETVITVLGIHAMELAVLRHEKARSQESRCANRARRWPSPADSRLSQPFADIGRLPMT